MRFKKTMLTFYFLTAVATILSCKTEEKRKMFDEMDIKHDAKKIMNGDELKFCAVSYTDEKMEDVCFNIVEKSTNKKVYTIPAEDITTYEYHGEYTTYYESKWTVADCRSYEDTSELWYYVEVSAENARPIKSKPFRIFNPHIIDFRLINDSLKGKNRMRHIPGIYYREYVRIYFKGCDLYGLSDYFHVDFTERDKSTDGTWFRCYTMKNNKRNNTYLTKKFRLVTLNPKIDWVEKYNQTEFEIVIYPQIYFSFDKVYKLEADKKHPLLKEYDDDLKTRVGIGIFELDIPYWIFKDLKAFSQLLKNIEEKELTGYSVIVFNGGEFILQL